MQLDGHKKIKPEIIYKKKVNLPDVPDVSGSVLKRFYYEIKLSDGSKWVCDNNGENWKEVKELSTQKNNLSDDELLANFLKTVKNI